MGPSLRGRPRLPYTSSRASPIPLRRPHAARQAEAYRPGSGSQARSGAARHRHGSRHFPGWCARRVGDGGSTRTGARLRTPREKSITARAASGAETRPSVEARANAEFPAASSRHSMTTMPIGRMSGLESGTGLAGAPWRSRGRIDGWSLRIRMRQAAGVPPIASIVGEDCAIALRTRVVGRASARRSGLEDAATCLQARPGGDRPENGGS